MVSRLANRQRVTRISAFAFTGSMLAMACTSMAAAQGTDTEAAPAVAQSNANEAEIVVTANKREQRLNDVGLAVAVVGGDALKNQQISSLADITQGSEEHTSELHSLMRNTYAISCLKQ